MKIIDYCLICRDSPEDLVRKVQLSLAEGWQPYGSVVISHDNDLTAEWLHQAMVKYAE
jgi:hypothetical protein